MDIEKLLIKYVALVTVQEGLYFATSLDPQIGYGEIEGGMGLTDGDKKYLAEKIFPVVGKWYCGDTVK